MRDKKIVKSISIAALLFTSLNAYPFSITLHNNTLAAVREVLGYKKDNQPLTDDNWHYCDVQVIPQGGTYTYHNVSNCGDKDHYPFVLVQYVGSNQFRSWGFCGPNQYINADVTYAITHSKLSDYIKCSQS